MRDIKAILKLSTPALAAALFMTACTKTEEAPPPVPSPVPPQSESTKPSPAATPPAAQPTGSTPSTPSITAPTAPTAPPTAPSAALPSGNAAQVAAAIETAYISNPEFNSRVEQIYKLADAGTPQAIASLGRLFHMEKETDLKTEIVDSLFDIDGQDDRKAALFAAAAGADQPKEVRESAIDGLEDIEAKYALPILQGLLADPDEDIRDAAKDAIEMLQTQATPPK